MIRGIFLFVFFIVFCLFFIFLFLFFCFLVFFLDYDMSTFKVIVVACLVSPSLAKINAGILADELNRVMEDAGYKELQVNKS